MVTLDYNYPGEDEFEGDSGGIGSLSDYAMLKNLLDRCYRR